MKTANNHITVLLQSISAFFGCESSIEANYSNYVSSFMNFRTYVLESKSEEDAIVIQAYSSFELLKRHFEMVAISKDMPEDEIESFALWAISNPFKELSMYGQYKVRSLERLNMLKKTYREAIEQLPDIEESIRIAKEKIALM